MLLADKLPRSYVGLYQKFLYKILWLFLTPPPPNILRKPPSMKRRLCLGQGAQFSVLLRNLCPSAVVSVYLPNSLPTQRLDNHHVTHQAQVTCCSLSYEAIFFPSANVPGETLYCANIFVVVREEGEAEGLFEKEPAPPPPEIHNLTAPSSAPGYHVEAGVFNAFDWAEDIFLVRNQWLEVDDDMVPSPDDFPLVDTTTSDTLF